MKAEFRTLSEDRSFWAGAAVATHQDLSALVRRSGRPSSTAPRPARSRSSCPWRRSPAPQYAGFLHRQRGAHNTTTINAAFTAAWDLHKVKPSFFLVPGCVVPGHRN